MLKNRGIKSFRIASPVFAKFSPPGKSIVKSQRSFQNSRGLLEPFRRTPNVPNERGEEKNLLGGVFGKISSLGPPEK